MTANTEEHALGCGGTVVALVALDEKVNTSNYVYRIGDTYYVSNVARSVGWHEFIIRCTTGKKEFLIDGVLQANKGTENLISALYLGSWWSGNTEISYFDQIFVRAYVDPEPSHGAWGPEESPTASGGSSSLDVETYGELSLSVEST